MSMEKRKMRQRRKKNRKIRGCLGGTIILLLTVCLLFGAVRLAPSVFEKYFPVQEVSSFIPPRGEEKEPAEMSGAEGGFYFGKLSSEEQGIYGALLRGVQEEAEAVDIPAVDGERAAQIYEYLLYDKPELFWCDGTSRMTVYEDHIEFRPGYSCTGEVKQEKESQIEEAAQLCLREAGARQTDYEKVRYIFEYLVDTVDYQADAPDNQNIYSALVNQRSVCAGYSRAAQYLLERLGMECIYVIGAIEDQGSHAWNIVNCGGLYYHVDVTFGDPVFLAEEGETALPQNAVNYDYLCCTDAEITGTHRMAEGMGYPACTSDDLNYYRLGGMYYETFDSEEMLKKMNESFYAGDEAFTCKFSDEGLYQEAYDTVINELLPLAAQNFGDYYGMDSVKYSYVAEEKLRKITVFWDYGQQ